MTLPIIDTHAHIIDPARFPFAAGPGYKPRPDEAGAVESFCAVLDANHVGHAVLVQPSGYGTDNAAVLDAMARHPGRFKAIAVIDPDLPDRGIAALAERGCVGVRFNLPAYQRDGLTRPGTERFLARLKESGWFAQVFADDEQWPEVAPILRRSGVKVLVDHFGVRDLSRGTGAPGFAAVLALGRAGNAAVKLSAPFRTARPENGFADLDPFAEALVGAFGIENCLWGSDWPFINLPGGFRYEAALRAVGRWLDGPAQRDLVLCRNPARIFGFGG